MTRRGTAYCEPYRRRLIPRQSNGAEAGIAGISGTLIGASERVHGPCEHGSPPSSRPGRSHRTQGNCTAAAVGAQKNRVVPAAGRSALQNIRVPILCRKSQMLCTPQILAHNLGAFLSLIFFGFDVPVSFDPAHRMCRTNTTSPQPPPSTTPPHVCCIFFCGPPVTFHPCATLFWHQITHTHTQATTHTHAQTCMHPHTHTRTL
jgi:hypothetical protein